MSAADAIATLVEDLNAAGVRATSDQRALNPPGALVALHAVAFTRLAGLDVEATVYLVAQGVSTVDALAILDPLIAPTAAVAGIDRFEAVGLPSLDGGDPLPALRGTATLTDC